MTPHEWRIALVWVLIGVFAGIVLWGCDDVSHNETRPARVPSTEVVTCGYTTFRIDPNGPQMWVDDYGATCRSAWMASSVPLFSLQKEDRVPAFLFMSGGQVYAASERDCVLPPSPTQRYYPTLERPCPTL